jgi:hypothetical protein
MDDKEEEEEEDEDDEEEELGQSSVNEGKLFCPGCNTKIGRWSALAPLECSCGSTVNPPCCILPYQSQQPLPCRYDTKEIP